MPTKRSNGEVNIRQRSDRRWEACYSVGNNPVTKPLRRSIYGGPVEKNGKARQ